MKNCRWTSQDQIAGHYASWAIRQSPYDIPDGLEEVIKDFIQQTREQFGKLGLKCMTEDDIKDMVMDHIKSNRQASAWNERKNGNQAPYNFVDRFTKYHPDNDFIDLDALVMNIARSVYLENAEYEERSTPSTDLAKGGDHDRP